MLVYGRAPCGHQLARCLSPSASHFPVTRAAFRAGGQRFSFSAFSFSVFSFCPRLRLTLSTVAAPTSGSVFTFHLSALSFQPSAFSFQPFSFSTFHFLPSASPHAIYGRRGDLRFSFSVFTFHLSALSFQPSAFSPPPFTFTSQPSAFSFQLFHFSFFALGYASRYLRSPRRPPVQLFSIRHLSSSINTSRILSA